MDDPRRPTGSVPADYFERLYAADPDPWAFATSPYERAKYAATLDALAGRRYARALEIGCSIGVLTERLAAECDDLLAIDVAEAALEQARARCTRRPHVRFERRAVPAETPTGPFDLVVVSEVGYYLGRPDLRRLRDQLARGLDAEGRLLLVHWTRETGYPLSGDAVHEEFVAAEGWHSLSTLRAADYRLDLLVRNEPRERRLEPRSPGRRE